MFHPDNTQDLDLSEHSVSENDDYCPEDLSSKTSSSKRGISAEDEFRSRFFNSIKEKDVQRARIGVLTALILSSAAMTCFVFFYTRSSEHEQFELRFSSDVEKVMPLIIWEVQHSFALMKQLSAQMTLSAFQESATFPLFTHPQFEIPAEYAEGLGGFGAISYAPLVTASERLEWEDYSVRHQGWLQDSMEYQVTHPEVLHVLHGTIQDTAHEARNDGAETILPIIDQISKWEDGVLIPEPNATTSSSTGEETLYAPLWQVSPPISASVNANLFADERISELYSVMVELKQSALSAQATIGDLFDFIYKEGNDQRLHPHMFFLEPVYLGFDKETPMVGFLTGVKLWKSLFERLLPEDEHGVVCVISDTCGNAMTFKLDGPHATYLGAEDMHDEKFNAYKTSATIEIYDTVVDNLCVHELHVFPSQEFQDRFETTKPVIYTLIMGGAFLFTISIIMTYDRTVNRRQQETIRNAIYTNQIVSSLFPENVHQRLLEEQREKAVGKKKHATFLTNTYTSSDKRDAEKLGLQSHDDDRPIADLFPHTTVMLGDLSGFTAWASSREPVQVFQLLETLYGAFDKIAKRRRVFKVETVGDCYVAVAGLPNPRVDHATVMARFAKDCINRTSQITSRLESILGPDTAELALRVGLHSGPVTGGVLRGENSRFQLFGDTINTAARMESTSLPSRIQVSKETAENLKQDGKGDWLRRREESIHAKGKGQLETYWLVMPGDGTEDNSRTNSEVGAEEMSPYYYSHVASEEETRDSSTSESVDIDAIIDASGDRFIEASLDLRKVSMKTKRLISWNASLLLKRLEAVVQERHVKQQLSKSFKSLAESENTDNSYATGASTVLDDRIVGQMHDYVAVVAALYSQSNPFHNFEHASHVVMAVNKLLSRVVTSKADESQLDHCYDDNPSLSLQHNFTDDIASDALVQLAVVLSALIHDVDHSGVPNSQLVKEDHELARRYGNKSVAENHSIERSWSVFMNHHFEDLRECICPTSDDLERFHGLVVNAVLATDIVDKELKAERNQRWDKVFSDSMLSEDDDTADGTSLMDRRKHLNMLKAKIVLEHLIQASDVSHTMQHWHVYCKWNERLFQEMWDAYENGRSDMNPAEIWYKGELGFFDFYIIPLTKKLDECGVFGVSSHEYLSYAIQNRSKNPPRRKALIALRHHLHPVRHFHYRWTQLSSSSTSKARQG